MSYSHPTVLSSYYYNKRCYMFNFPGRHWGNDNFFTAKQNCESISRGASLMRIENAFEYDIAKIYVDYLNANGYGPIFWVLFF